MFDEGYYDSMCIEYLSRSCEEHESMLCLVLSDFASILSLLLHLLSCRWSYCKYFVSYVM